MEHSDSEEATRLERELKKLLNDVPELGEFFGLRTRKLVLQPSSTGTEQADIQEGVQVTFPGGQGKSKGGAAPLDTGDQPGQALIGSPSSGSELARPISRTSRQGPKIVFASYPDRVELAWVEGSEIVINSGHPSYAKTRADAAVRKMHCLFAIGSAVQRFIASTDNAPDLTFVDRLMSAWGKK